MNTKSRLIIPSPAKVNLFLEILGKRPDGYHEIETIIQEVDLADQLEIKEKTHGIYIKTDSPSLPRDKSNLVYRAAELLKRHCRIKQGVEIIIRKRIPVGGGLGGGSSNAACTLKGLNRLWRLEFGPIELSLLAAQLGSDVPFFIYGGTALCKGRGEIVFPLVASQGTKANRSSFTYLIIYPGITVPTRRIYHNLNCNLTKHPQDVSLFINKLCQFRQANSPAQRSSALREFDKILFNRLEATVLKLYPVLGAIKTELTQLGLSPVLMSGSGSSFFGPVGSRKEGKSLERKIRAKGLGQVWLTRSHPISPE